MKLPMISSRIKRLAEIDMPVQAVKALLLDLSVEIDAEEARLSKERERKCERQNLMGISHSEWLEIRLSILERDRYVCAYCGSPDANSVDHIKPVIRGGSNDQANLVTACFSCNSSKGARTIEEWERFK